MLDLHCRGRGSSAPKGESNSSKSNGPDWEAIRQEAKRRWALWKEWSRIHTRRWGHVFHGAVASHRAVGPISFLGLIIANLSRQLLKTFRHTQLVLGSALFGMIVLVGGQLIVEHVYSYSVPVSVFITVGGGLYFLYLLLTRKKV